jgi:hypothetical protein
MNKDNKEVCMTELVLEEDNVYICTKTWDINWFSVGNDYPCGDGYILDEQGYKWSRTAADLDIHTTFSLKVPKTSTPTTSIKVDLRNPDGTIDVEKNLAFQEAITGGAHSLYCGNAVHSLEELKEDFSNIPFIYVLENGMLALGSDEYCFKNHSLQEVEFTFKRELTYEITEVYSPTEEELLLEAHRLSLNKTVKNLQEQLQNVQKELEEL